ncbi:hypothetical protein ACIRL2_49565 [Embleya sp. NPDC127516]|uniref:hypothetical protein n=1 Tax=Embleya sp. NPDC127516 TaxID=3363990 RepID=UPI00381B4559
MTRLDELREELRALDAREEDVHRQRARVLRDYVREAGGLTDAAALLQMNPRSLVQLQRLGDLAMVVYRGPGAGGTDDDGRAYGETGTGNASTTQQEADGAWWRVAKASRPKIRALVVVDQGVVARVWPVDPSRVWRERDGRVALPLGDRPLTAHEIATRYPGLGIMPGDERPMRRGLLREYVPLEGPESI